ncbi:hypothetical protein J2S35_000005 [Falsarthrobacter nasiphocae]|uniref:Uncharacterized protein n=1 Tax=Falsarthrobacter nasiphocae TaxID=189863 RepID=A0AAE3YF63_9MICC|nr:hypothetical protein [Falsarthrobacter nasiphocae]
MIHSPMKTAVPRVVRAANSPRDTAAVRNRAIRRMFARLCGCVSAQVDGHPVR